MHWFILFAQPFTVLLCVRLPPHFNTPSGTGVFGLVVRGFGVTQDKTIHTSDRSFILAWELYATSVFCFQPGGDSATRRGFFDSLLFGCIPVIDLAAAEHYTKLYQDTMFPRPSNKIEDVVVVMDLGAKGGAIFQKLLQIRPVSSQMIPSPPPSLSLSF